MAHTRTYSTVIKGKKKIREKELRDYQEHSRSMMRENPNKMAELYRTYRAAGLSNEESFERATGRTARSVFQSHGSRRMR